MSAAVTGDPNAPDRTYTYSYDLAGNRVEMADTGAPAGQATLYSLYDADGRLSETADQPFQDGGQPYNATYTETFTYDKAGNTLTDTATTYDGYGTVLGTQTTTDTWDLQGRLVGTQTPTGTVTDTYDALGRRTSQTTGGATTNYLNDPTLAYDQVLEEYAPGGARLATYVRGLDLLFQDRAGTPSYYVHDGLGSTRALTDANGAVTDTYTYGPYGGLTATGSTVNPYLYAGQRQDATGGYVMGSRTYDVSAARFTSRDSYNGSTDDPITQNHYLYAGANPANYIDPDGHEFTLSGIEVDINIISQNFVNVGTKVAEVYDKVDTFKEAAQIISKAVRGAPFDLISATLLAAEFLPFGKVFQSLKKIVPSKAVSTTAVTKLDDAADALTDFYKRAQGLDGTPGLGAMIGEISTAMVAKSMGLVETGFKYGRTGLDVVLRDPVTKKFIIAEAKGPNDVLRPTVGHGLQMSADWIESRIETLIRKNRGLPEADELREALSRGDIMAMVVGTSEAGGKITPKFQIRNFKDVPPTGDPWPFATRYTR